MKIGSKIKNFKAEMTGNKEFSLSDYLGKNVVIYFYPRDNTPGCTSEGEDFRDNYKFFRKKKYYYIWSIKRLNYISYKL